MPGKLQWSTQGFSLCSMCEHSPIKVCLLLYPVSVRACADGNPRAAQTSDTASFSTTEKSKPPINNWPRWCVSYPYSSHYYCNLLFTSIYQSSRHQLVNNTATRLLKNKAALSYHTYSLFPSLASNELKNPLLPLLTTDNMDRPLLIYWSYWDLRFSDHLVEIS